MLGTLRESFLATVSRWPDGDAIISGESSYTFGALNARANQLANFLTGLGIRQGDHVGLLLDNCAEFAGLVNNSFFEPLV